MEFGITKEDLQGIMRKQGRNGVEIVDKHGGINELCKNLKTSVDRGISSNDDEIKRRQLVFGENILLPPESKTLLSLIWEALQDSTLIILEIAATVSLLCSIYKHFSPTQSDDQEIDPAEKYDWIEGVAILVSVIVVVLVTAFNDYSKERQFRHLKSNLLDEHTMPLLRDGTINQVRVREIVVGDICLIKYGDLLPADGIIVQSNDLKIDESSLTGESDLVVKNTRIDPMVLSGTNVMEGSGKILITAVGPNSQNGIIMALLGLGDNKKADDKSNKNKDSIAMDKEQIKLRRATARKTINFLKESKYVERRQSRVLKLPPKERKETSVLQTKLLKLGYRIGQIGTIISVITVIILYVQFFSKFINSNESWSAKHFNQLIDYFIIGISVLVVAVPEGLPLAVTLSLAYSVKKMMNDNNLVRHLDACETMGNATTICSDKTGTLTTNRMTVVQFFSCEKLFKKIPKYTALPINVVDLIVEGISINTLYTSNIIGPNAANEVVKQIGNKTECALLGLVRNLGFDYEKYRLEIPENQFIHVYTFNSDRKSMSTVIMKVTGPFKRYRIYTKGASEIILKKCQFIFNLNGQIDKLDTKMIARVQRKVIAPMAENGLRTIALAYRDIVIDGPGEINEIMLDGTDEPIWDYENDIIKDLTFICIAGIEDPLRPEVPHSIELCQRAGITVRMITGDNIDTARSIALKAGIIKPGEDYIIMDSKQFNEKILDSYGDVNQVALNRVWPRLRVLARSQPSDKYNLVKGIIDSNLLGYQEVVAVTGDGTNDGPALKVADVGFAMGITGTDVAKEACDIIITDDNFSSIVKAVMWGRNVYDSISKFIQFQLTVNIVAVTVAFTGACVIQNSPLKAVQLLWVNLIMDTLASLALATEMPTYKILNRKPYGRTQSLISAIMIKNIITQALYQLIILFLLLFYGTHILNIEDGANSGRNPSSHYTIIFNTLVIMTLFNEINSRKCNGETNCFSGICTNPLFICIWIVTLTLQVCIVQLGNRVFFTFPLNRKEWLFCMLCGFGSLIWGRIVSIFPLEIWAKRVYEFYVPAEPKRISSDSSVESVGSSSLGPEEIRALWMRSSRRLKSQIHVIKKFRESFVDRRAEFAQNEFYMEPDDEEQTEENKNKKLNSVNTN